MGDIKLQVYKSSSLKAGQQFILNQGETVIGRKAEDAQIVVPEPLVSRKHCVFHVEGDAVSIDDLKSGNGTFFNGKKIQNKTQLKGGDKIQVGDTYFEILHPSQAEKKTSPPPRIEKKPEAPKKPVSEPIKLPPPSSRPQDKIKEDINKIRLKKITTLAMALLFVLGIGALFFLGKSGLSQRNELKLLTTKDVNTTYSWVDGGCKFRHPETWQRLQMYTEPVFAYSYFDHSVLFFGFSYNGEDVIFAVDLLKGMPATLSVEGIAKSSSDVFPRVMAYGLDFLHWKKSTLSGREAIFTETPVFERGGKPLKALEAYILDQGRRYLVIAFTSESLFPQFSPIFQEMMASFEIDPYTEEFPHPASPRDDVRLLVKSSNALVEKQDVKSENLYLALKDYRKAAILWNRYAFDPNDPLQKELLTNFQKAQTLLDNRYKNLKFKIERGLRIGDDESIYRAVKEIMAMIPNPEDERYKYAISYCTPELKEKFENMQNKENYSY
ncbi:MAG: FHA domain-containing protein [Candidatus Aureabacteria bacterium]|nr:FHA domain-containing protein [Candidatus Auribacterota bacterium]